MSDEIETIEFGKGRTIYFYILENGERKEQKYHIWVQDEKWNENPDQFYKNELLKFDCDDIPSGISVCEVYAQVTKSKLDIFDSIRRLAEVDRMDRDRHSKMEKELKRTREKLRRFTKKGRGLLQSIQKKS